MNACLLEARSGQRKESSKAAKSGFVSKRGGGAGRGKTKRDFSVKGPKLKERKTR